MAFVTILIKGDTSENVKISEEVVFENIEQKLNKWMILKVNCTKIYNKGVFD